MRNPRGVDRITVSYDMPAVIKESTKVDGGPKEDTEVSHDTNNSANVENVCEHEEIILVTTGDTMPSETTINLDLDEEENDNDNDKNAKLINVQSDEAGRHKSLNGTDDGPSKVKNDDKHNADVSSKSEHTSKNPSELVNGIGCNYDDDVNDLNSNKTRSSTESLAAIDKNGAVERNEQRSSNASTTATKSNKRKISISSEDEQPPPAKKY